MNDLATETVSSILASSKSEQFLVTLAELLTDDQYEMLKLFRINKMTCENDSFIKELPREMWIMIMSYLDLKDLVSFSSTSKSFRTLCMDPELWRQTVWTVTPEDLLQHPESYAMLFSRLEKFQLLKIEDRSAGSNVRSGKARTEPCISIQNMKIDMIHQEWKYGVRFDSEHADLAAVVSLFSNLTSIDFGESIISDSIVEMVASRSPNLQKFMLVSDEFDARIRITDKGVISLVSMCPNLVHIRIRGDDIGDASIKMIGQLDKLEVLDISVIPHGRMSDLGLENVVTNCKKLRELTLDDADITDKTLELLGKHCPDLATLKLLDCCERVTENGVRHFVEQGSKPLKLQIDYTDWDHRAYGETKEVEYMPGLRREFGRLIE